MKKPVLKIFISIFFCAILVYFAACFILPLILNSSYVKSNLISQIMKHTNTKIETYNFHLLVTPTFKIVIAADEINFYKNQDKFLSINNLDTKIPVLFPKKAAIEMDYLYFKKTDLIGKDDTSRTEPLLKFAPNFSRIPNLKIKKAYIELGSKGQANSFININNFLINKIGDNKVLSMDFKFTSKFLDYPLISNSQNKIFLKDNSIVLNDFPVFFGNGIGIVSGTVFDNFSNRNFSIIGRNLPVHELENTFLLITKQFNPKKNFIENFYDFEGLADINLYFKNKTIDGIGIIRNLKAKTVLFNVPIYFKKAQFNFEDNDVYLVENGYLGNEKVKVDFLLTDMYTNHKETSGNVKATLSEAFAKKYIDKFSIEGNIDLSVDYIVKKGVSDILYTAQIPPLSDVSYFGAFLGLRQNKRTLEVTTKKKGDIITMTSYNYSYDDMGEEKSIIKGDGVFSKKNGRFKLDKISGKTMLNAPVSLLGFLQTRLSGGVFSGNLEYDYNNKKILGSITLNDSRFKNFIINNAAIFANNKIISILADGTFRGEIYNVDIEMKNSLTSDLFINKLELFLKKFVLNPSKNNLQSKKAVNILQKFDAESYKNVIIQKLVLRLDEFQKDRIVIKNIILNGTVKNSILNFATSDLEFARGILNAKGKTNFKNKTSDIIFHAEDIDSNEAAYQFFNLKNHFQGVMDADLTLHTGKGIPMTGQGSFQIEKGKLLHFGTKDFIIDTSMNKNPYKYRFSDIVKVNKKLSFAADSNIKGNFTMTDQNIDNADIYMQSDVISMYIKGSYKAKPSHAKFNIWGKYDSSITKGITIFHIPLNLITKFLFKLENLSVISLDMLNKVPKISAKDKDLKNFNINIEGDINTPKKLKFEFNRFE